MSKKHKDHVPKGNQSHFGPHNPNDVPPDESAETNEQPNKESSKGGRRKRPGMNNPVPATDESGNVGS